MLANDRSTMTTAIQTSSPTPVEVYAYTESLCIDCQRFFQNQLYDTYSKLGPNVIDLHLVPFGNAKIVDPTTEKIQCQHGDGECDANLWEQCAVEQATQPMKGWGNGQYVEFFKCLEDTLPMGHTDQKFDELIFMDCAEDTLDPVVLKACHDNAYFAWTMQQKYSELTPEHDYVPWVVVNGRKIDEENEDLFQLVCKEFVQKNGEGTPIPEPCASVASTLTTTELELN